MRSFGELLTEYMARTGISDTELARTLGVRRQTIFRWKEGLVERPRRREDVLLCARRLRLTAEEQDELLLAGGFSPESTAIVPAPETAPEPVQPVGLAEQVSPTAIIEPTPLSIPSRRTSKRAVWAVALVAVLLFVVGALVIASQSGGGPVYPFAAQGETLIVIAPLAGSPKPPIAAQGTPTLSLRGSESPSAVTNVNSRLQAALQRELLAARLDNVRVEMWPEEIRDDNAAEAARQRAGARILIWGTYNNGPAVTGLALAPAASRADDLPLDALVAAPADLKLKIDTTSPEQMQTLALLALGYVYVDRGEFDKAQAALTQASVRETLDPATQAALAIAMGYVAQVAKPPDLNRAAQFYTQAISLTPDIPVAFLNRGVIYVRQNQAAQWQSDFARVLALKPDDANVQQALCWAYALDNQPQLALPHCDTAVGNDRSGRSRDARGIVYAELGQLPEAAGDLKVLMDWLGKQPESLRARYGSSRADWLQALQAGQNPINASVLEKLRKE